MWEDHGRRGECLDIKVGAEEACIWFQVQPPVCDFHVGSPLEAWVSSSSGHRFRVYGRPG